MQMSVGVGLDTGVQRRGKPNEDFVFATTGVNVQTQETYGLFVVADGLGGHADGQLASRLGTETIVDIMLPLLHSGRVQASELGNRLADAITRANDVIYERNQRAVRLLGQMGTTITVTVVFGPHAFIANVGDSRTYLYRPESGLRVITRDHSVVANLVASGSIAPDDVYTHPERNKILRSLGVASTVEIDLFYELLQNGDIVFLCSDGMWEMTRDSHLEQILSSPLSPETMAEHLLDLAIRGGGRDNIGLVVSQCQMNVTAMQTVIQPLSHQDVIAS